MHSEVTIFKYTFTNIVIRRYSVTYTESLVRLKPLEDVECHLKVVPNLLYLSRFSTLLTF